MNGDVDFEIWISDRERVLLGELVPGMELLQSVPTPDQIGRPLYGYLHTHDRLSWGILAKMQASEVMLVPNVGPGRLNKILRLAKQLVAAQPLLAAAAEAKKDQVRQEALSVRVVDALVDIASWAEANGIGGSVLDALAAAVASDDPGVPVWALKVLADADLAAFADPARVVNYDPRVAATQLFLSLDVRHDVLLDRVLAVGRPAATLDQMGAVLGVTRERVRQLSVELQNDIAEKVRTPAFHAVQAEADRFAERHGAAFSADVVLQGRAVEQVDNFERLILMLAGPFRFDGEWFSRKEATPVDSLVLNAFEQLEEHGAVARDDLADLLGTLDVRDEYVDAALALAPLRLVGDMLVDWRGSLAAKAIRILHLRDEPMDIAELIEAVGAPSRASFTNQLSESEQVHRVGLGRYGLTEWDMESYSGIVPAMVTVLRAGPVGLNRLADDLHREFGASPNSVRIMAGTHPAFLLEDGVVRLRPADQPYVPKTSLTATRGCFVVDGCWSLCIKVDHDFLRGSGRQLPEAFAVHLGLEPLGSGRVRTPVGSTLLRWGQSPNIGSLRLLGEHLDVELGDLVFLRRNSPSSVDAVVLRQADLPEDPNLRLRALVGSPRAGGELEQVLSDALGLRGTVNHDFTEERDALLERGESDLVELLDQVMKGD